MNKASTFRLVFLYAVATMGIVAAACALLVAARLPGIRSRAEVEAAAVVSGALTPPLAATIANGSGTYAAFTYTANNLTGDQIRSIRLWDLQGNIVASAGDVGAPGDRVAVRRAAQQGLAVGKANAPSGTVLDTYVPLSPGTILEIQQHSAPVSEAISASTRELVLYVSICGAGLALVFPAILWFAVRGFRNAYDRLALLHRSGRSLRAALDPDDILGQLARDAALFTRAHIGLAAVVDGPERDLVVRACYDADRNDSKRLQRRTDQWFMRGCVNTGDVIHTQLEQFPYTLLLGENGMRPGAVHVTCVPIPARQGLIGVVVLGRAEALAPYTTAEVETVAEMASVAGMALEQASKYAEAQSRASEMERGYDSTLKVLSAAIDGRDVSTNGHSERIAGMAVALARQMGLSPGQIASIERGALLHDIGKVGVPEAILNKRGALNETEWEAVQRHPLVAGLMVSRVDYLEQALPVLLYHHERFDGAGYPFGLQGPAIPIEARVFSVVDAVDAMTSDRPYRQALLREQALAEIQQNAGTQFDPDVVEAFLQLSSTSEAMAQAA